MFINQYWFSRKTKTAVHRQICSPYTKYASQIFLVLRLIFSRENCFAPQKDEICAYLQVLTTRNTWLYSEEECLNKMRKDRFLRHYCFMSICPYRQGVIVIYRFSIVIYKRICVSIGPLRERRGWHGKKDISRDGCGDKQDMRVHNIKERKRPELVSSPFLLLTCFFFLLLRRIFTPPEHPKFINHKFRYHVSGHRSGQRNVFYSVNTGKSLCNIITHHC